MPTGDFADEAAFREQMGLSPYQGISSYAPDAPYAPPAASRSPYTPLLENVGSDTGVDADYLARIMKIESGGDPRNRTGSYRGLFQLSPSEFAKYGGTGDIYDPEQNARAAANKTAAEARAFQEKFGRAPTSTDLYMTHQQGEGGYAQHIAAPDAPAWENMYATAEGRQKGPGWAKQAIWGNIPDNLKPRFGSVNNVTSQDLIDIYARKLGYGADRLPLAFGPTGSPAGLPEQADPEAPLGGSPIGNPVQAADIPPEIVAGGGGATEFSGQRRMPPGQRGAPPGPPEAPAGNLPFGIPGTFLNNPIQRALGDNFSTLLAFAGGARQGGIGQGLTQAAKASLIEGPQIRDRENQAFTEQALIANGLAPGMARAAARDPKLLAQIEKMAPQVVGRGKDILGRDQFVVRNPLTGQERPYEPGQNISGMGTTGAPAAGVSGTPVVQNNSQEIAKAIGVKNWASVNEDLPAEEYLAQFPKEVQAAVRNKVENNIPFPANPRQGQETATNLIGQLYAEKAGIPIDANAIKLRKEYLAGLQKTNPASIGGQRQGYNLMAEHGAVVTAAAVELANSDLGLTPLSKLFNMGKNLTSANAEKVNDLKNGVQKWNAEIEKLYAGGNGSITAREHAELLLDPNASPREIAGTIRSNQDLVAGKLRGLQAAHEEALPPRFREKHKMIFPETEQAFKTTAEGIKKLKAQSDRPFMEQIFGGTTAAPPASARVVAPPPKPGNYVYDPATRKMILQ